MSRQTLFTRPQQRTREVYHFMLENYPEEFWAEDLPDLVDGWEWHDIHLLLAPLRRQRRQAKKKAMEAYEAELERQMRLVG